MRPLNAHLRGKDKPTNVLSFPCRACRAVDARARRLGDIVLGCRDGDARRRREQASRRPIICSHLVVHGLLHLLGYDHETDAEAEVMEALEIADPGATRHRQPL